MNDHQFIILICFLGSLCSLILLLWFIRSIHRIIDLLKSIENLDTHILNHVSRK